MSVAVIEEPHLLPTLDILFAEQCCLPPSSTASSEPPSPSPLSDSTLSQNDPMLQLASSTSTHTTASASASASASPSASPSASASTSSLAAPPRSVKFAPLPELGPRKRRSNAPLGMAARGALARRRRPNGAGMGGGVVIVAVAGTADIPPDVPPENIRYVTPAEFEAHRMQQEAMAARYAQHQGLAAALAARQLEAEQEAEFEREEKERELARAAQEEAKLTGKKVKLGKTGFWKRVVQHRDSDSSLRKDGLVADGNAPLGKGEKDGSLRRTKSDIQKSATPPLSKTPSPPIPPLRPILATVKSNTSTNSSTTTKTADKTSDCDAPATGDILPTLSHTEGDLVDGGAPPPPPPPAADADTTVKAEDSDLPTPSTDDTAPIPTPETPSNANDAKANDDP